MIKRILSCVLCAAMLFSLSLAAFSVSADDIATFTLNTTDAGVGETMYVSVTLSADSCFTNATIYLHYNTEAVSFVKATAGYIASSGMYDFRDMPQKAYVRGVYATIAPITEGGEFFVFEFTVLKDIPATFELSFDECVGENTDGNLYDLTYITYGSTANNDGSVNDEDLVVGPTVTPATTPSVTETQPGGSEVTQPSSDNVTLSSGNSVISPEDEDPQFPNRTAPTAVGRTTAPADAPETSSSAIVWICIVCGTLVIVITVVAIVVVKKKH